MYKVELSEGPSFRRTPESSQTIPSCRSRQPQLPFTFISTFHARLHPSAVFSRTKGHSGFRLSPERRGLEAHSSNGCLHDISGFLVLPERRGLGSTFERVYYGASAPPHEHLSHRSRIFRTSPCRLDMENVCRLPTISRTPSR